MEKLKFKYESISKWIENADLKAQIFIGVQLFIVGFILENKEQIDTDQLIINALFFIFLFSSCVALYYLYRVVKPRLSNENYNSRIYYRDLARNSVRDFEDTKEQVKGESEDDFRSDITDQILAIAKVCNEKYEMLNTAEGYLAGSFVLGLLVFVLEIL